MKRDCPFWQWQGARIAKTLLSNCPLQGHGSTYITCQIHENKIKSQKKTVKDKWLENS